MFLAGATLIGGTIVPKKGKTHRALGSTDSAAQVDEASDGDDQQLLLWPAERQEWLQSTLAKKDGVEPASWLYDQECL